MHDNIPVNPLLQSSIVPSFPPGRRPYGPEANCERSELICLKIDLIVKSSNSLSKMNLFYQQEMKNTIS